MALHKDILIPAIFFLFLLGLVALEAMAEDNIAFKEDDNSSFNLDQMVKGTGFFSTYKRVLMPDALGPEGRLFNGVESASNSHGSGKIEGDSRIHAESYHVYEDYFDVEYDEDGDPYDEEEDADSIINISEGGSMLYSPSSIAIGSKYYANHPVTFNSLLSDATCIKNRDILGSINRRVQQSHGLKKDLYAYADYSSAIMNIDDDVADGRAHIGMLELAGTPVDEEEEVSDEFGEIEVLGLALKDWKHPKIELDMNYLGTFHMIQNISLISESDLVEKEEAWLPCCNGGWEDMLYSDQKGFGRSTKGIFDCSCPRLATAAQFDK